MRSLIVVCMWVLAHPCPGSAVQGPLEVDHVFIAVSPLAPEASALASSGFLIIPDTTIHEGQGTASIVTVFENAYLELIWVQDSASDRLDMAARAAWRESHRSPFGIGLRRVDTLRTTLPFKTQSYEAPWMLPGTAIEISTNQNTNPEEPLLFVVPPYMAVPSLIAQGFVAPPQPIGIHRLTGVRVIHPAGPVASEAARVVSNANGVAIEQGTEHLLVLEFDDQEQGKELDLRPQLPLVIRY